MIRSKLDLGFDYVFSEDEDEALRGIVERLRSGERLELDLTQLVDLLTDERGKWDPEHDQQSKCNRFGCEHPYERHFDSYGDMEPVGCKYCSCERFIEPLT